MKADLSAVLPRIDGAGAEASAPEGDGARPLARERAFEAVKDAIIAGRIAPGTRLVEREMCDALGVSRTVVREVVRRLEAERLVEALAHRGPRVAELTPKVAREIYDLRAELEVLLVRDFIARAGAGDIAALGALLADVEDGAAVGDVEGLVVTMRRFYAVLMRGADNSVAADTLESLHARISRLRVLSMAEPGRALRSVGEIRAIVEAVAARDASAAEAATRAYVTAARDAALRQLASCPPSVPPRSGRSAPQGRARVR